MTDACARCFREAEALASGPFRNGRPAREPLCSTHAAEARTQIGTWRLLNTGARESEYRLVSVEPLV